MSDLPEIPLYKSVEGRAAEIVRCALDDSHIASREAFENVGGCPYCLRTQDQRISALRAKEAERRASRDAR